MRPDIILGDNIKLTTLPPPGDEPKGGAASVAIGWGSGCVSCSLYITISVFSFALKYSSQLLCVKYLKFQHQLKLNVLMLKVLCLNGY